jgi:alkanesulfonate monooxygenase SsuD/methylene tetrahydromethanopterin reductase-like flavin-dependent oxidoreductase (luciferase family)
MTLLVSAVGSPETVERGLLKFIEVTQPDEIITTAHIYDHSARLRSFELLSQFSGFANQAAARTIHAIATAN